MGTSRPESAVDGTDQFEDSPARRALADSVARAQQCRDLIQSAHENIQRVCECVSRSTRLMRHSAALMTATQRPFGQAGKQPSAGGVATGY